jgi:hypothetical protein
LLEDFFRNDRKEEPEMSHGLAFALVKLPRFAVVFLALTGISLCPMPVSAGTDTVHLTAPHQ